MSDFNIEVKSYKNTRNSFSSIYNPHVPPVTSHDDGDVLKVVDGKWKDDIGGSSKKEVVFSFDLENRPAMFVTGLEYLTLNDNGNFEPPADDVEVFLDFNGTRPKGLMTYNHSGGGFEYTISVNGGFFRDVTDNIIYLVTGMYTVNGLDIFYRPYINRLTGAIIALDSNNQVHWTGAMEPFNDPDATLLTVNDAALAAFYYLYYIFEYYQPSPTSDSVDFKPAAVANDIWIHSGFFSSVFQCNGLRIREYYENVYKKVVGISYRGLEKVESGNQSYTIEWVDKNVYITYDWNNPQTMTLSVESPSF